MIRLEEEVQKFKEITQYKLANFWYGKEKKGTLQLATGCGKSRIGVIILKHFLDKGYVHPGDIHIACPTEAIRDEVWPKEIIRWAGEKYLKQVRIECIQTLYKERNKTYGLTIADEIHNYLPEDDAFLADEKEYIKWFTHNIHEATLGLSAFIPKDRMEACNKIAPIIYTITIDQALQYGFISNFKIYNIPVQFTQEELDEYIVVNDKYLELQEYLGGFYAFENAQTILGLYRGKNISALSRKNRMKYNKAKKYMEMVNLRKAYLYDAENKISACNKIIDAYPDKCIVFSTSKKFANAYAATRTDCEAMHSDIGKPKRKQVLRDFSFNSHPKVMSAVRVINEGIDIPKVKLSVLCSGTSKRKDFIQILGRNARLYEDLQARLVNLFIPNTQDEEWLKSRTYGIDTNKIINLKDVEEFLLIVNNFKK